MKNQAIEIIETRRKRKTVSVTFQKGESHFLIEERDAPLPAFGQAFDALLPLVAIILHLPESWLENCRVCGLKFGTQGGSPTVSLLGRKGLNDASKEFIFATPPRLLRHPVEPGSYTPPLTEAQAGLIEEALEQSKCYVRGERAQGEIQFKDEDGDGDGEDGITQPEQGELVIPEAPKKRGRGRPRKTKVESNPAIEV